MYRFRVYEGGRLVREFRRPADVTRHIEREGGLFSFSVEAGYATSDSGELEGARRFTGRSWLKKGAEAHYRRRMRLERQAEYDAKRRQEKAPL